MSMPDLTALTLTFWIIVISILGGWIKQ